MNYCSMPKVSHVWEWPKYGQSKDWERIKDHQWLKKDQDSQSDQSPKMIVRPYAFELNITHILYTLCSKVKIGLPCSIF